MRRDSASSTSSTSSDEEEESIRDVLGLNKKKDEQDQLVAKEDNGNDDLADMLGGLSLNGTVDKNEKTKQKDKEKKDKKDKKVRKEKKADKEKKDRGDKKEKTKSKDRAKEGARDQPTERSKEKEKENETYETGRKEKMPLERREKEKKPETETQGKPQDTNKGIFTKIEQAKLTRTARPESTMSFNSRDATLMEPISPKSSSWSRPVAGIASRIPMKPSPPSDATIATTTATSTTTPVTNAEQAAAAAHGRPQFLTPMRTQISAVTSSRNGQAPDEDQIDKALRDLLGAIEISSDNEDDDDESLLPPAKVDGLTVELLHHQRRGLKFLLDRERKKKDDKNSVRGGLLCDDMGLGKTIQSLALILSHEPKKSSRNKTLVVAPVSLISQWANEIKTKTTKLKVLVHHGPKRATDVEDFEDYHVILTSHSTLMADFTKSFASSPVYAMEWWRIILDEAQTVCNSRSKTAEAVFNLKGKCKWCLSGTPIQNSVNDLFSLFKFIGLEPFNNEGYWEMHVSRVFSWQRAEIPRVTAQLKKVLQVVMLRRTKDILTHTKAKLPEKRIHTTRITFSENESNIYQQVRLQLLREMSARGGDGIRNTALLRMKQTCNDWHLLKGKLDIESTSLLNGNGDKEDDTDDLASLMDSLTINDKKSRSSGDTDDEPPSSKTAKLLELLRAEPKRKTILFSQFTGMFDLLEPVLRKANISYARYEGKQSTKQKEEALDKLRMDPKVTVLLCSLKCGALGLNLTCASRVVIFDLWWNPMVEDQAIDRVHRLGQTEPVDVYLFMVQNTIEEKILEIQTRKRELAKDLIGTGKKSMQLTKKELLDLVE